jgi:DNA-binding beta-propeller fold protein YncE
MPARFATAALQFVLAALALAVLSSCGGGDTTAVDSGAASSVAVVDEVDATGHFGGRTPTSLALRRIGGYDGLAVGAAEITAYDPGSRRLFVVNGANGTVDVLDLSRPEAPGLVHTISVAEFGAGVNSVAVHNGLVALAIEASPKTDPGVVALYRAKDLQLLETIAVGALPDMLTFTPDGRHLLVANEGEPNSYGLPDSTDPEGSISVIKLRRHGRSKVETAHFRAYNGREDELRAKGIRIYGPGASAAQDFEPEYITVSPDGRTAYVTLQENNAIAIVDIDRAKVVAVKPLGYKDHNVAGAGLDASDEDGGADTNSGSPALKIAPQPVRGLYLPDAIASYRVKGRTYLVTANEGDARADWPGFNEETRVRAHCSAGLDPTVFGADAAKLLFDSNLGRLRITATPNGGDAGKNAAGECKALYAFGARSFTIWTDDVELVYDSGDGFEQRTTALPNVPFNASNDNATFDARSPNKGPEPEGVVIGQFGRRIFAFVGLERVGGVMVYDITDPKAPSFATYLNTRNGLEGDRGPEGLFLIDAADSPNRRPLLVVGHETSGTTAVYEIVLGYGKN